MAGAWRFLGKDGQVWISRQETNICWEITNFSFRILCGFTASIGAQLILKGKITKKGLLTPLDIPYGMMEDEISMRGIKIEKNISN